MQAAMLTEVKRGDSTDHVLLGRTGLKYCMKAESSQSNASDVRAMEVVHT